jgi:tetrapyrrole methylase family protein/MazG family protein
MIEYIIAKAREGEVVVGLPGHPLVGERLTLELLNQLDEEEYHIHIIPGISRADALLALVQQSRPEGLKILMAPGLKEHYINVRMVTVVLNLYHRLLVSDIKVLLLRFYPPELEVYLSWQDGAGKLRYTAMPLYELDRQGHYDDTTCLYLPSLEFRQLKSFDLGHLAEIMELLRSSQGCPWDRKQTHESLKQYLIEETYEVLEAIDEQDEDKLLEELGDVLLQVVFHGQMARERGEFDLLDITTRVCQKMINRHTHIFKDTKVENAQQVENNWEELKKQEKGLKTHTQVLRDIPAGLPALMRSYKVQKKAALVGFDWDEVEGAIMKVEEELDEVKNVYTAGDCSRIEEEIGDLLFAVVNVSRFFKIQPELALTAATEKFIRRFQYMEENAREALEEMSLEEMDSLWNQAKTQLNSKKHV